MLRQFGRQIDPIPEYEPDIIPNKLPTPPQSTTNNRRSPSPIAENNQIPTTTNTNKIWKYLLLISVNFCRDLSGDVSIINFEFCCWTRHELDADCWIARDDGGVVA